MDSQEAGRATYILPLRTTHRAMLREMAKYVNALPVAQIIVADASPPEIFEELQRLLTARIRHIRPDENILGRNGKVRNVLSALRLAEYEHIVVADDDVRYDRASLHRVLQLLQTHDVVRPQNYFAPLPWHAWLDTGRILINRALDGDWPGTLAFRRSMLPRGYNADVLFENYELVRTICARGGSERVARDIFVLRRPPVSAHFFSQRIRQAYDEFARPARLAAALAILPVVAGAFLMHAWAVPAAIASAAVALAAIGRIRDGGAYYFPLSSILAAPLWLAERAVCAWLAVYERARYGGVRYAGGVVRDAVSSPAELLQEWAH